MTNLNPELRPDKNGKMVTRHVKANTGNTNARKLSDVKPTAQRAITEELPTLDDIRENPSPEDINNAWEYMITNVGNEFSHSWERVMGRNTRRTDKNIDVYKSQIKEIINSSETYLDKLDKRIKSESESSLYARAYEQGVTTPLDGYLEEIWTSESNRNGFDEAFVRENLERYKNMQVRLANGTINPGAIVGSGYRNTAKVAKEYLERSIRGFERDIETRGRSNAVNVSNAKGWLRRSTPTPE